MKLINFKGEAPKLHPERLSPEQAQNAVDVNFDRGGILSPAKESTVLVDTIPSDSISLYRWSQGNYIGWNSEVNVIKSPIAQDDYGRIYFTGDGKPKVISATSYPASFNLGVPAPASQIIIGALTDNIPDGVDEPDPEEFTDDTTRYYVETFVTAYGEEGSFSPVSSPVELAHPYKSVALTLNSLAVNNNNVTKRRIYRSATTDAVSGFYLVAELPLATTSFDDTLLDEDLGPEMTTGEYYEPPVNMKGLTLHPSGYAIGIVDNEVLMSEPYLPYAWPLANRHSLEYNAVAIGVSGDMTVIATDGKPYALIGTSPDATNAIKLELAEACVSSRSLVDMGQVILYASRNGLVAVSTNGATLVTEELIDKDTWSQFEPETIRAYLYDKKYVAFTDNGGFIFDPKNGDLSKLSATYDCGYHDMLSGELLVSKNGSVELFNNSNDAKQLSWKSKDFIVPDGQFYSFVWIEADDISKVGFELTVNGQVITNKAIGEITNSRFRIRAVRGQILNFTITAQTNVKRISFGQSLSELS